MNNTQTLSKQPLSSSEAAINGLLWGLFAGVGMILTLVILEMFIGESPAVTLARFDPGLTPNPISGALLHLAVSGIYGLLFGLLWVPFSRRRSGVPAAWVFGTVFGLGLWVLAEVAVLPGTNTAMAELPGLHLALAHMFYGLTLGWLAGRNE